MKTRSRVHTTIDRDLYIALEAMEQVAARQQAEIDRLREVARLARITLVADMAYDDWVIEFDKLRDAVMALDLGEK